MAEPYKIRKQYMHTEVVFYDGEGTEVARERQYDDSLWDDSGPEPLTDDDRESYYPEEG